ncbi:MAG: hypothetical protein HKN10_03235, partial [Myxococcales bacterium]|nr:hypothetical protein [Myxococcales bacterium]
THLWGTAEDDIFLAAGWGLLAHFDGTRWRPFEFQGPKDFYEMSFIFGFTSDDVYVGIGGQATHYDGESWSVVEGLSELGVFDMWGSGPNDVYALGSSILMHFDGLEWSEVVTDLPTDPFWRQITGSGEKHVVVLGQEGAPSSRPRFAYFDGLRWREAQVPVEGILRDVWSAGPNDTYAVGRNGTILHFDGEKLTQMDSGTDKHLSKVHGTPGGEVFAVGPDVALRFDGSDWNNLPPPDPSGSPWVASLFAFGADSVFVAGRGVHRFDGASWETHLPYSDGVDDIWASDPENVLFAGRESHRYDGFSVELEDFGGLEDPDLNTAWGTGDQIFAAADEGFFLYDGEHWGKLVNESDIDSNDIIDMFGISEDDVFGVGWGGLIAHFDGSVWQAMDSGTDVTLVGVWASAPDDVYAVGNDETVLHYDGSTWSELFGSGLVDHLGVTGFDAEHIVALRDDGVLTFSDGVSWRPEPGGDLEAVHGTAPDNLFGIGPDGLSHYDGEQWTSINRFVMGVTEPSIFAAGPRDLYVAGPRGVFRYTPKGQ